MRCQEGEGDGQAAQSQDAENDGSADLGAANRWWLSPVAYGLVWYAVIVLLFAVPNAKYADMKYESWDKRKSIGIGGWSACSVLFSGDEDWAAAPYTDINGST